MNSAENPVRHSKNIDMLGASATGLAATITAIGGFDFMAKGFENGDIPAVFIGFLLIDAAFYWAGVFKKYMVSMNKPE